MGSYPTSLFEDSIILMPIPGEQEYEKILIKITYENPN